MSNTDTLKQGYEAFGRGDLDGVTQNFADDIRWENPEAQQVPNNGTTVGKDNVEDAVCRPRELLGVIFDHPG